MSHETDTPTHDFFDGFVPNTPSTNNYLEEKSETTVFGKEMEVYSKNKDSIDNTFSGQYIVMDPRGKIIANSADLAAITKYAQEYFGEMSVWAPKIPKDSTPKRKGGVGLKQTPK